MKVLIAIPSKGRADSIFRRTLRWVPRTGFEFKVFCEPSEIQEYRDNARIANGEHYLDIKDEAFIDIGKNNGGLSHVRSFMKDYAIKNKIDLIFRIDDDVMRFNSRGRNKPDGEMVIDFAVMVAKCRSAFGRYKDVAAVGFPYRGELFPGKVKEWSAINARLQTCYIIKPEFMVEGFNNFDDFADYINIRKQNKVTLRYGLLGMDVADVGKTGGGLQTFDREELANSDIPKLREIHPALVLKPVKGKSWTIEPDLRGEFYGVKNL